jgi:DNA replication protein DnaC
MTTNIKSDEEKREDFLASLRPANYLMYKNYDFAARWESLLMIATAMLPNFQIYDESRRIYENGIRYFSGDPKCEWNLKKGIYLYGKIGSGKTTFFRIFKALNDATKTGNTFRKFNMLEIIDGYQKNGSEYFKSMNYSDAMRSVASNILIDDLGQAANNAKYYGNSTNIISELIQRRYLTFTDNYKLTHISTNLEPQEIGENGEFVSSRMREMFNIILFPGNDKRK